MTSKSVKAGEHATAFAQNIRIVRAAQARPIQDLVKDMARREHHMSIDQYKDIELGRRTITLDDACEIARALQVRLAQLVQPAHVLLVPNRPAGVFADRNPMLPTSLRGGAHVG